MTQQIIGLKELREKVAHFAREVQRGKSFIVVKQSKPLFKISRPIFEEEDLDDDGKWETLIDFTKIRKGGVPFEEIIKASKELDHEQSKKTLKQTASKRSPRHHR